MKYDAQGNPIVETTDNSSEETTAIGGDFIDSMISGLLTDEEKTKVKVETAQESEITGDQTAQTQTPERIETDKVKTTPETTPDPDEEQFKGKTFKVNGVDVSYDELKNGYLRQSDYTKKAQELADERQRMAPYQVLNDYLEKNPDDFTAFVEMLKTKKAPQAPPEPPQRPEDPLDALAFDATQNALNAVKEPLNELNGQITALSKGQQILTVQSIIASDPLQQETKNAMKEYVYGEYAELHGKDKADEYYEKLKWEPAIFANFYQNMRKRVVKRVEQQQQQQQQRQPPEKVETVTPFVAGSETALPPTPDQKKMKRKELKALQDKTRGGKVEDVIAFLSASGMVDHLS